MGKGRAPCCDKSKVKKGPWSLEEDLRLINFVQKHGHPNWRALPKQAGLLRCGKSCRLRWINYLRPDLKRGNFTKEEEETIIELHQSLGNKWSKIASHFPGRTDNEIKNVWNTYLKKRVNKKEEDHIDHHKDDIKENSSASSSSCFSILSPSENQEMEDVVEGKKKQANGELKENPCSSNSSTAVDYFPNCDLIDVDNIMKTKNTDFLINNVYQENYGMFSNTDQDIEVFPLEVDFEFWEKWDKEDPIYSNQSQKKEFDSIFHRNLGEENKRESECMKWLKSLEDELLL